MPQINIVPVVENRTYETLYFDSKPGIYKMQDSDDYYLYITEKLILMYNGKLSVIIDVQDARGHKFTFVTDKYYIDSNRITFVDSPRSFKLKDSPPQAGTIIRVFADNSHYNIVVPSQYNWDSRPLILNPNDVRYSGWKYTTFVEGNYEYTIVGKITVDE